MFYDLEILKRRGGKFGVIWLVANQKMKLKGKGWKKDLRVILRVKIDRICQDLVRYVRIEIPAKLPGDSNPRFSLYLAAMLTHGAILVHHRQVTYILACFTLSFQQQQVEKTLKDNNISCNALDLTDVVVGATENCLGDKLTLEEREFGQLVDVIDALRISAFQNNPPEDLPEAPVLRNLTTSVDEIEQDFAEFFRQTSQTPNGNIVSPNEITLREFDIDPVGRALPELIDDSFGLVPGSIGNIPEWGKEDLPPVVEAMEVDYPHGPTGPGKSNLQRSNSKRAHDDVSPPEDVPNKQSRIDQPGEPVGPLAAESNDIMEINLEPLEDLPNRARLRRPRRLIIDNQTIIPTEKFQSRLRNYGDTLRVTDAGDDRIIPQYAGCTVDAIIRCPSVLNIRSPLRDLITRNMVTLQVDDAPSRVPFSELNLLENSNRFEASGVGSTRNVSVSKKTRANEMHDEMPPFPEQSTVPDENIPINDATMDDVERPRARQSNEPSLIGSLNASNLTVRDSSGLEISRSSPIERQVAKNPCMDTLVEASVETSRATKNSSLEDWGRASIQTDTTVVGTVDAARSGRTLPPKPLPILRETDDTIFAETEPLPLQDALQISVDGQVAHGSPVIPMTIPDQEPYSSSSYFQVNVPEGEELINMIDALTDDTSDTVTFRELVPPSSYHRIEAAMIFCRLLVLKKGGQIDLYQEFTNALPYGDIYINFCNR